MTNALHCSFCGKSQHEVRKLIAGPSTYICDECVALCNGIIDTELEYQRREVGLFEQFGRALDARSARKRQSRAAAVIARQAPVERRRIDAAVREERDRCSSIIEGEVARLERNAGQLLGWSVTQAKLRVLRHMADLIGNPRSAATERHQ